MQNRIDKAILLLLALAIGLMSTRLIITLFPQQEAKANTAEGISFIAAHETVSTTQPQTTKQVVPTTEKQDKKHGKKNNKQALKPAETTTEKPEIKDGNFKAAYKDFIISGDSLVKAIYEYGILDSTQVIAEIGVGTSFLSKSTDEIVAANPKYLVLHYGENELDEKENAAYYVNRYKKCIEVLKERLPDTKIYVDSIFPVEEKAHKSEPYTVNIDYYNTLLKKMAEELNVTYIDYTQLWNSFEKDYYDADGIHPIASFYTEQYLPYVYTEVLSKN